MSEFEHETPLIERTLFIIRGVPGTGKTTLANLLTSDSLFEGVRFSADDFFYDKDGNYNFDPSKLPEAHNKCRLGVEAAMIKDIQKIAVDNTSLELWEFSVYLKLCERYGYVPFILTCETNFGSEHDVPEDSMKAMRKKYQSCEIYHSTKDDKDA